MMVLFSIEMIITTILIIMILTADRLQEKLSYGAYDRLSRIVGILTVVWIILVVVRWLNT